MAQVTEEDLSVSSELSDCATAGKDYRIPTPKNKRIARQNFEKESGKIDDMINEMVT